MRKEVTVASIELGGITMKTFNRKVIFLFALISAINWVLVPQFMTHYAQAEVERSIADGNYQVELNFLSIDGLEHNQFFNEEATLNVANGHYTVEMTINDPYILQEIHSEQSATIAKWTEDLVQFDVKDLKEPILINGLLASQLDEGDYPFAQQLRIIFKAPIVDNEEEIIIEETTSENEWFIDTILYADGKKEPSIMNTYVNPLAKVIKKDGKYYAQMTILKSAWITGLTVEQHGEQLEPTVISVQDNRRIVEFEVVDFERPTRMWVKVDIPEIAYHHQYYVELQFDEQQVANMLEKPLEAEPPKQVVNVKPPVVTSEQIEKPLAEKTVTSKNNINLLTPSPKTAVSVLPEETLAFDRTLDANAAEDEAEQEPPVTEEEKEKKTEQAMQPTTVNQQLAQLDKVKIVLLVLICVLSGWLVVRRLRNSKKTEN